MFTVYGFEVKNIDDQYNIQSIQQSPTSLLTRLLSHTEDESSQGKCAREDDVSEYEPYVPPPNSPVAPSSCAMLIPSWRTIVYYKRSTR